MHPLADVDTALQPLAAVLDAAKRDLDVLDDAPALDPAALPLLDELDGPLPATGPGAGPVIERLIRVGTVTATRSSGRTSTTS
jgi:hypothetical protein